MLWNGDTNMLLQAATPSSNITPITKHIFIFMFHPLL